MTVWLELPDICARTGMSPKSAYRAIHEHGLKAYRLGGRLKVKAEDLDAWLEQQRVGASA
jgi:excisionase family DNA binding protein